MRLTNKEARACGIDAPKGSKMGNVTCIVDGIRFDSAREAERYGELMILYSQGLISHLRPSPETPKKVSMLYMDRHNDKALFTYMPDFVYISNGVKVYEDVKPIDHRSGKVDGKYMKTAAYRMFDLKRKLIEDRYGIKIEEV